MNEHDMILDILNKTKELSEEWESNKKLSKEEIYKMLDRVKEIRASIGTYEAIHVCKDKQELS